MEVVQKYWKVIDEFFESITPSVGMGHFRAGNG